MTFETSAATLSSEKKIKDFASPFSVMQTVATWPNRSLHSPLSLSTLSLQSRSSCVLQSRPSHPSEHLHCHTLSPFTRHCPCPEQLFGHPSSVQCLPFQPVTHRHVPFLHCPCSLHRSSHSFVLQYWPDQPAWHAQVSPTQWPCAPQSRSHSSGET